MISLLSNEAAAWTLVIFAALIALAATIALPAGMLTK